jgi:hypothetical protein
VDAHPQLMIGVDIRRRGERLNERGFPGRELSEDQSHQRNNQQPVGEQEGRRRRGEPGRILSPCRPKIHSRELIPVVLPV